jgi:hypothetical protein
MGAELGVANLDGYLINYISSFFWRFELAPLRGTCRRLRRALATPKRRNSKQLFIYAMKHDSIPMLQMAKEKGYNVYSAKHIGRLIGKYGTSNDLWALLEECGVVICESDMLYGAAEGHRNEWCKIRYNLDRQYCHWFNEKQMIRGAAAGGNLSLLQWLFAPDRNNLDYIRFALHDAAAHNQMEVCSYLKEVGRLTTFDTMLSGAARKCHIDLCRLAKEWGLSTDPGLSYILEHAIWKNNIFECILALDWGISEPDPTPYLRCISKRTSKEICSVLIRSGAVHLTDCLIHIMAFEADEPICKMLLHAAPPDEKQHFLEELLHYAARKNCIRLCYTAKQWGACDFNDMLNGAILCRDTEPTCLALEWGAVRYKKE